MSRVSSLAARVPEVAVTQHQPEPPSHRKFMVREGFVAFIAGMWVESIILALVGALVGGLQGGLDLALGGLGLGLVAPWLLCLLVIRLSRYIHLVFGPRPSLVRQMLIGAVITAACGATTG
jgi:hypothetical protein